MKYLISEKQYMLILEQPDSKMPFQIEKFGYKQGDASTVSPALKRQEEAIKNFNPHTALMVLQIGAAFIPFVGPFISAGIGLADAGLYYKEGDTTAAGLSAAFSLIPFAGQIIGKIPGAKQLSAKAWSSLASKVASKSSNFTNTEKIVLNGLAKNQNLVKVELNAAAQKIKPLTQLIKGAKPQYIKRFGQKAYDDLFSKLVSNKITKEEFTKVLQSSKVANSGAAKFLTKFGIKFLPEELQSIRNVSNGILSGKGSQVTLVQTKNGLKKITIQVLDSNAISKISPNAVKSTAFKYGDDVIVLNKSKISSKSLQEIEELVGHEVAHIKDPSMVSSRLGSTYAKSANKATVKNYDLHPWEINANTSASLQTLTNTTKSWMKYLPKDQLLGYLDDIINWGKGTTKMINPEVLQKMIGKQGMEQLITMYKYDKKSYTTFLRKIVQQADYLKGQVKIAM